MKKILLATTAIVLGSTAMAQPKPHMPPPPAHHFAPPVKHMLPPPSFHQDFEKVQVKKIKNGKYVVLGKFSGNKNGKQVRFESIGYCAIPSGIVNIGLDQSKMKGVMVTRNTDCDIRVVYSKNHNKK